MVVFSPRLPLLIAGALAARGVPLRTWRACTEQRAAAWTQVRGGASSAQDEPRRLTELSSDDIDELPFPTAIASDVDGTLTSPLLSVPSGVQEAIVATQREGIFFFPATGKTRAGMINTIGALGRSFKAGVYSQGLIVYGPEGELLFERCLEHSTLVRVCEFCREREISLLAYSGDRILCDKRDAQIDKLAIYHEPEAEEVGPLDSCGLPINKVILMGTEEQINQIRPDVEKLIATSATATQAMPDMLEVLPPGASKGDGVARLLKRLNIPFSSVMAMGDAENDVEMLRLAGLSVAMGNAAPAVKAAAHLVAPSNAEEGAAVAIERLVLSRIARRASPSPE